MELNDIRSRWNEVLDALLEIDRITWLAFFDARLASFDGKTLKLDFSDARKLAGGHEYSESRKRQFGVLEETILRVLEIEIVIAEQ